jgi:hypothetical protein
MSAQSARAMSLAHHLALAACRGDSATRHQINELVRSVYMAYFLEQTNFTLRRLVLMSASLGRHPEREEVKPTRRPLLDLEPASALLRPYFPGLITVTIRPGTRSMRHFHS